MNKTFISYSVLSSLIAALRLPKQSFSNPGGEQAVYDTVREPLSTVTNTLKEKRKKYKNNTVI